MIEVGSIACPLCFHRIMARVNSWLGVSSRSSPEGTLRSRIMQHLGRHAALGLRQRSILADFAVRRLAVMA